MIDDDNNQQIVGVIATPAGLALTLAVIHHGMSCFAAGSIPAKVDTVLHTADMFERRLLLAVVAEDVA